jgi:hypothetical protein
MIQTEKKENTSREEVRSLSKVHIETLRKEQEKRLEPFQNSLDVIQEQTKTAMADILSKKFDERINKRRKISELQTTLFKPLTDIIQSQPDYKKIVGELKKERLSLSVSDIKRQQNLSAKVSHIMDGQFNFSPSGFLEGDYLDVLSYPYGDIWTSPENHYTQEIWANKDTGKFRNYIHVNSWEKTHGGSGIYMFYVPSAELNLMQIRPYMPYNISYILEAGLAEGTSHVDGYFGCYVWSFDKNGNDQRIEQQYEPQYCSDGVDFWSPWESGYLEGLAFHDDKLPNAFYVSGDRIYTICLFSFASCDSGVFSWIDINAEIPFVVIAGIKVPPPPILH